MVVVVVGVGLGLDGAVAARAEAEAAEPAGAGLRRAAERVDGDVVEAGRRVVAQAQEGVEEVLALRAVLPAGVAGFFAEAQEVREAQATRGLARQLLGVLHGCLGLRVDPGQLLGGEVRDAGAEPVVGRPTQHALQRLAAVLAESGHAGVGSGLQDHRDQSRQVGVVGRLEHDVVPHHADGVGRLGADGELEARELERRGDGVAQHVELARVQTRSHVLGAGGEELDEAVDDAVDVAAVGVHPLHHADDVVEAGDARVLAVELATVPLGDLLLVGHEVLAELRQGGVFLGVELRAERVEHGLGTLSGVVAGLLQALVDQLLDALGGVLDGRRLVGDVVALQQPRDDLGVPQERAGVDQVVVSGDELLHGGAVVATR